MVWFEGEGPKGEYHRAVVYSYYCYHRGLEIFDSSCSSNSILYTRLTRLKMHKRHYYLRLIRRILSQTIGNLVRLLPLSYGLAALGRILSLAFVNNRMRFD